MTLPRPFRFTTSSRLLKFTTGLLLAITALPGLLRASVGATVDTTQAVRTVDDRVFGVNSVMWDGNTGSAQTISMVQAAGIRMIRMPGGSNSDTYHWRVNKSEGGTTNGVLNTWTWKDANGVTGFNAFINLFTSTNAQPMVTVNYGSGTPQEAAGLVAYLNATVGSSAAIGGTDGPADNFAMQNSGYWASIRAATPLGSDDGMNFLRIGRTAPIGAKYFEVGNECYGSWEYDQQSAAHDPTTYANRAQQYITAMKAVDPTIKIGVVVVTSSENANYHNWTPTMLARLKTLGVTPDFVIYHLYPQAPFNETDAGLLQVPDSGSNSWATIASDLRNQVNTNLGTQAGAGVEIVVTENNCVYSQPGKQSTSLVNGLYLADSVANLMQTEINGYMWWALRNGTPTVNNANQALDGNMSSSLYGWRMFGDYGMLSMVSTLTGETTAYDAYPTYYMMKLLQHFARNGDTVVKATSSSSLLSVFAAHHADGTLSLLVINKNDPRTTSTSQSVNFALTGFNPTSTANVYSYGKTQDDAAMNGGTGAAIDVASSTMSIAGASFGGNFGPYSATVISLSPAPVNVAPSFAQQPSDREAMSAGSASFTVAANGTPAPSYQWQREPAGSGIWSNLSDGAHYAGSGTATLSVNGTTFAMNGDQFRCVATNVAGSATSNTATLRVQAAAGDFNADGQSDLVIQNTTTGERSVWLMNGTTHSSTTSLTMLSPDWQVAGTGDFNADGQADLIWQNTTTGDRYIWLMNGSTHVSTFYLTTLSTDWQIAGSGDFNGDGQSDLIWQNKVTGDRYIWLMNGTTHTSTVYLTTLSSDWQIAGSGDFNGDGQSDLIWQNTVTGDCYIWLMNGTAVASKVYLGTVGTQWQIGGSGDFNGDGQADLYWTNTVNGERTVWLMNGTTHASTVSLGILSRDWVLGRPITMPKLAAADFNADGNSDLVWQNTVTGDRYLWLMNGTAQASAVYLGNLAPSWQIAGTGDFNADGQSDIIWQNVNSGDRFIWLMNGTTLQANVYVGTVPPQWQIVGSGDFNGDGQTDLLWQNTVTGDRYIWLMNGTTMVSTVYLTTLSTDWQIAGTGDFNGDGQPDILWQNTVTGDRYLWLMNGTTHVSTVYLTNLSSDWQIAGTGDFNGDGQSDILWQNTVTGDRYVWLMNGTTPTTTVYLGNLSPQWSIRD